MQQKHEIIIVILIFFIAGFFINSTNSLECKTKYSYCKVLSTNLYNIPSSKSIIFPNDILGTSVSEYKERRGSRGHRRTVTLYRLEFLDKSSTPHMIFKGYSNSMSAEKRGQEIMECIRTEKYPCKFNMY